jgi:hypothetical protein
MVSWLTTRDPDGQALTALLMSNPANGALTWNADGSFRFTPAAGFQGTVTFTYSATDGVTQSVPATVALNIQNQAAVAITEIMFNPASGLLTDEWIEVRNTGAGAVNLRGWQFTKGVSFTFPIPSLAAGRLARSRCESSRLSCALSSGDECRRLMDREPQQSWRAHRPGECCRAHNRRSALCRSGRLGRPSRGSSGRSERLGVDQRSGWHGTDRLQLRNLALPNDNGQNWASATPTPGAANTDRCLYEYRAADLQGEALA